MKTAIAVFIWLACECKTAKRVFQSTRIRSGTL